MEFFAFFVAFFFDKRHDKFLADQSNGLCHSIIA